MLVVNAFTTNSVVGVMLVGVMSVTVMTNVFLPCIFSRHNVFLWYDVGLLSMSLCSSKRQLSQNTKSVHITKNDVFSIFFHCLINIIIHNN